MCFMCNDLSTKGVDHKPEGWSLDKEHCNNCMICVSNCYANALQISGSYEASEELVAQAKRDQQIFGEGGVNFFRRRANASN